MQAAVLLGIAALLGACLGSFVNCLAWRLVNGESVLRGRSHCTSCGHALGVLDLVPIVSWLALRGRCRHCGSKVSPRYVIVELLTALLFVALVAVYGFGLYTLAYAALVCVLMGVALVDLDSFTIPNGFVIAVVLLWVAVMAAAAAGFAPWSPVGALGRATTVDMVANALVSAPNANVDAAPFGVGSMFVPLVGRTWIAAALDGLAGAVAVGGGILAFSLAFDAVTKRTSLGGGDVKLLFAVGLFLGLAGSLLNLLVACVVGLVFAVVLQRFAARVDRTAQEGPSDAAEERFKTKAIPFGPAIAAATMLTLLVGPTVLTWYVGLL